MAGRGASFIHSLKCCSVSTRHSPGPPGGLGGWEEHRDLTAALEAPGSHALAGPLLQPPESPAVLKSRPGLARVRGLLLVLTHPLLPLPPQTAREREHLCRGRFKALAGAWPGMATQSPPTPRYLWASPSVRGLRCEPQESRECGPCSAFRGAGGR